MDPIERKLIEYGMDQTTAQLVLAAARMAQVLVYGIQPPPDEGDRMNRMNRIGNDHPADPGEGIGAPAGINPVKSSRDA